MYNFTLCVYNFSTLIWDLVPFFFSKILFCTKFNCSMSYRLALLNRRMLVRHAMAYVGILRMEAICWRYGESRRTAIFLNKPEVSNATCPEVRDLLVARILHLPPWTIVPKNLQNITGTLTGVLVSNANSKWPSTHRGFFEKDPLPDFLSHAFWRKSRAYKSRH